MVNQRGLYTAIEHGKKNVKDYPCPQEDLNLHPPTIACETLADLEWVI
jgi:hypothetical protein